MEHGGIPLTPVLMKQRQADVCELHGSLVYILCSIQTSESYREIFSFKPPLC